MRHEVPKPKGPALAGTVRERYATLVAQGVLEWDRAQAEAAGKLAELDRRLSQKKTGAGVLLDWLFSDPTPAPRGLYIWGEVGRGKTMLMDLFFETVVVRKKRRTHFHVFMAEVHERIFEQRRVMKESGRPGDPIPLVADAIAAETELLCFDEFQVTDIADAMILGRLFGRLFERGVVLVATSNSPPENLYKDGLNRALFLPFVDLLTAQTEVVQLASRTDYRLEKLAGRPVWYAPADARARAELDAAFADLTGRAPATPLVLNVQGRSVSLPQAARGVVRASFAELCDRPLGPADYLALARAAHTVILDDIPLLGPSRRDAARRFVTLIDALYDSRVKLLASAATAPQDLWSSEGGDPGYEAFAFSRTVSRLMEMQSEAYLSAPRGRARSARSGDMGGLVET